jgi:hypothetical protein
MHYVTTVTYTTYVAALGHVESRRAFVRRNRYLTAVGAERLIRQGSTEHPAVPSAIVVRVERAVRN